MDKRDHALMAAKSVVYPAAERGEALAAAAGVAVTIKASVYLEDGSKNWATVLAGMLCDNPSLASGNRQCMADLITTALGLSEPFEPTRLSKTLADKAKNHVSKILIEYGYDCSTLTNGLSIRDIVKKNIRRASAPPTIVTTSFYADHIELDGVSFQYRPRERSPMGRPENDFCIRVAGVDVPLMAVLKIRNIGLGEFRAADMQASKSADATQALNRERLNRDYVAPVQLNKLYDQMQRATRESDRAQRAARDKFVDPWCYSGQRVQQS